MPEDKPIQTDRWEQLYEQLQTWPPELPDWGGVDQFVESLLALAATKRAQYLAAQARLRLKTAIAQLQEQAAEQIRFFGFDSIAEWDATVASLDDEELLVAEVTALREQMFAYAEASARPVASLEAKRRLLAEQARMEAEIVELFEQLAAVFAAGGPSPLPPKPPVEAGWAVPADTGMPTGTTESGTDAPDAGEPGASEPGASKLGVGEAGVGEAGVSEAGVNEPDASELDIGEPDANEPARDGTLHEDMQDLWALALATLGQEDGLKHPEPVEDEAVRDRSHATPNKPLPVTPERMPAEPDDWLPAYRDPAHSSELAFLLDSADAFDLALEPEAEETLLAGNAPAGAGLPALDSISSSPLDTSGTLLWTFIAEDDIPGAYWLARSQTALGVTPAVPIVLLEAIAGGRWLAENTPGLLDDLHRIVREYEPDRAQPEQALLGLAAAMQPALLAPAVGMQNWLLDTPVVPAHQYGLPQTIADFARNGIVLNDDVIAEALGVQAVEERLKQRAQEANGWLLSARERRPHFKRASDVWRAFVKPDGPLDRLLHPVCENRPTEVQRVQAELERWTNPKFVGNMIDKIDADLAGQNKSPIVGGARQYLEYGVNEASELAKKWCALVEQSRDSAARSAWQDSQVRQLHATVKDQFEPLERLTVELCHEAQPLPIRAAAGCLAVAVKHLRRLLLPMTPTRDVESDQRSAADRWYGDNAASLHDALCRRLLWLPELSLDDNGHSRPEDLTKLAALLRSTHQAGRSKQAAFELWLERQDYRFTEKLLDLMPDADAFQGRLDEQRTGSQRALAARQRRLEEQIEQALVDGILTDEQRADYQTIVQQNERTLIQNFAAEYARMDTLGRQLATERHKRLALLRTVWEPLRRRLDASPVSSAGRTYIVTLIERGLEQRDTRVVEEAMAQVRQALETGGEISEHAATATRSNACSLEEFILQAANIEAWLDQSASNGGLKIVAQAIAQGSTRGGIEYGSAPKERREEARKAIEAWARLKQGGAAGSREREASLLELLTFLGFSLTGKSPIRFDRPPGNDWLYVQVAMSDAGLARPVPQFGSLARGQYHVICFWERPGSSTIAARIKDLRLNFNDIVVFYLGRLGNTQRRELIQTNRDQSTRLLVLDETLLLYLAKERDARLPAFLRCSLPYTRLSPYVPFQAGNVPPEMFFGREEMSARLMEAGGSCIVYGGRQLGKSALLRHVQREFHNPDRRLFAWVEDIKLVGDPLGLPDPNEIWVRMRDRFKEFNLITSRITTAKQPDIVRYIREAFNADPALRVLVLFDESDCFLDADERSNFAVVEELRKLMFDTHWRFKVVFAGLHSVQRFQSIPNQPLAHFGAPLCVGPLDPQTALALVREPIETLGFRFADDGTLLRTLSYTNYHPALIQLFCEKLLDQLYRGAAVAKPPYQITRQHVEAVYRLAEVRERIRERLDWTLALDKRYQAIAWVLIVDQLADRDSYAHVYPVGKILKFVQEWWPQGFQDTTMVKLVGLLNEMVGLGVLVRSTAGSYQLRSPNLVRLMGTEADIEGRLLELSSQPPVDEGANDSRYRLLDSRKGRYSPFTLLQERTLNHPETQSGAALVFASDATGLKLAADALLRLKGGPTGDDASHAVMIPPDIRTPDQLRRTILDEFDGAVKRMRLTACLKLNDNMGLVFMEPLIQAGIDLSTRLRDQKRLLRIYYLFSPRAGWTWLNQPEENRLVTEAQAHTILYPELWNLSAIRQRLQHTEKLDSDDVCHTVLECTGGWPYLLDILFDRCDTDRDIRSTAQALSKGMAAPASQLHADFMAALGLKPRELPEQFLCAFSRLGDDLPEELMTAEMLGGSLAISDEQCRIVIEHLVRLSCLVRREGNLRLTPWLRDSFQNL